MGWLAIMQLTSHLQTWGINAQLLSCLPRYSPISCRITRIWLDSGIEIESSRPSVAQSRTSNENELHKWKIYASVIASA